MTERSEAAATPATVTTDGPPPTAAAAGIAASAASPGQTAFFDSAIPALPAGDYQIVVTHTVEVDQVAQPEYGAAQRFRVTGPRTALGSADVVAMRPAAGSQGAYESWLPHVVLAQRTLPWQVAMTDRPNGNAAPAGTPWMALLLLTTGEIDVSGSKPAAGSTGRQVVGIGQLLSPPSGIVGPTATAGLQTLAHEQPAALVSVIDVHLDAFRAVAPSIDELPLLTHVRQVDPSDQEALDVPAPGWYSVVVGTRFPVGAPDNVYIAHLVSLEGLSAYLPGGAAPVTSADRVRLVSLASWSFSSTPDPADFARLMQSVGIGPLAVPVQITPQDAADQQVAAAADAGYTALRYLTRLGEETAGWFRGPLSPTPIEANEQPAYQSSSAAMMYDPVTGMFDASYAAAWELGRLLTLANGPVARSLSGVVTRAVSDSRLLLRDLRAGIPPSAPGGPQAAGQRARALIAGTIAPLLNDNARDSGALGGRGDPHGLRNTQLPGLVPDEVLRQLYDDGPTVYAGVRDQAIATARESSTPGPTPLRRDA
jgi:hypothetical protein